MAAGGWLSISTTIDWVKTSSVQEKPIRLTDQVDDQIASSLQTTHQTKLKGLRIIAASVAGYGPNNADGNT